MIKRSGVRLENHIKYGIPMLAGCYLPEPIPHYIETQMGHVSSQMVYNMYGHG
ncbi:hypothetical protein XSR1_70078 [Xenorhabdus szentirmaii DSM 16338]|uniref:Uncharacterized protein n=1 Tax=Xenorhabdus szentirmaii DSM 16338 TaxID=1427518 RepID=W1J5J8_9GAMM|nr:hypothetical protein XSR1_70078 [Xenorhabdus szentirmaii DSM 16338]